MSKPATASRPLTGYALTNHFRKLRLREPISHLQAYLFFELVAICNDEGWPAEFSAKNSVLMAALDCSEEGLIRARLRLKAVGLIDFISGNRRTPTRYCFSLEGSGELSQLKEKGSGELSDFIPNGSGEGSGELSNKAAEQPNGSAQGSGEGSGELSPLYKEQTKTKTLCEGEGELASSSALSASEGLDSQPANEPTAGLASAKATATPRADRAPRKRGTALPTGPAELLPTSCPLAELLNLGGLAAKVQQLAEPLTLAQAERLLAEYNLPALRAIFCQMANWPKLLTNSTSANLTARNWLSKRPEAETAPFPVGAPASQPNAPAYDPAVLFGLDLHLTSEQRLARQQSTPEYAAYIARQQQAGQQPNDQPPTA
jgi:hypothetical protein